MHHLLDITLPINFELLDSMLLGQIRSLSELMIMKIVKRSDVRGEMIFLSMYAIREY